MDNNKLIVTAAPHITSTDTTQKIMQRVCLALCPTLIASVIIFGINALILVAVTVVACVFFEWGYCKLMHRENPTGDFSAVVTGMLLAFNMPATLPWWMAIVGAFIAIVVVKQLFGGLGYNFANPAIVGRIAMAMGFAGAMSSYPHPVNNIDAFASATPLAVAGQVGSESYMTLLLGNHGFDVVDAGKDVPAADIVRCAEEHGARIIGLSALMTTTMVRMEDTIALIRERGLDMKVMVGGAAVTQAFADSIGADAYCEDAVAAVRAAKSFLD